MMSLKKWPNNEKVCNLDTQQELGGKKGGQCKGVQEGGRTNNNKTRWKK